MADGRAAEHAFRPLTDEQEAVLRQHPPGEAVRRALSDLLGHDHHLLWIDANERSITFRFAMNLQIHLQEWQIDCEYNREGVEPKKLGPGLVPRQRGRRGQDGLPRRDRASARHQGKLPGAGIQEVNEPHRSADRPAKAPGLQASAWFTPMRSSSRWGLASRRMSLRWSGYEGLQGLFPRRCTSD